MSFTKIFRSLVPEQPPEVTVYRNTFGLVAVKLLASGVKIVVEPDELIPEPETVLQVPPDTEGKLLMVIGAFPTHVLTLFPPEIRGSEKLMATAPVVTEIVLVVVT